MVYITSDLFGHNRDYSFGHSRMHDRPDLLPWTHHYANHDMIESHSNNGLGKRKRLLEDVVEGPSSKQERTCGNLPCDSVDIDDIDNIPTHLRSYTNEDLLRLHGHNTIPHPGHRLHSRLQGFPSLERRPVKQLRRLNPKISLVKTPSHLMDIESDLTPSSPPVQRTGAHTNSDVRPCHACNVAPKRKRDLENYMDCRRCEGRTCYICARQCSGCPKTICKKCTVEVGEDGDPWCLECYSRQLNN